MTEEDFKEVVSQCKAGYERINAMMEQVLELQQQGHEQQAAMTIQLERVLKEQQQVKALLVQHLLIHHGVIVTGQG